MVKKTKSIAISCVLACVLGVGVCLPLFSAASPAQAQTSGDLRARFQPSHTLQNEEAAKKRRLAVDLFHYAARQKEQILDIIEKAAQSVQEELGAAEGTTARRRDPVPLLLQQVLQKEMSPVFKNMRDQTIEMYMRTFTLEELRYLVGFLKTDAGFAAFHKFDALGRDIALAYREDMLRVLAPFQARLQKRLDEEAGPELRALAQRTRTEAEMEQKGKPIFRRHLERILQDMLAE